MKASGEGARALDPGLELTCFLHPGWAPRIRPAPATRPWMDATPGGFAYRCLPLSIANAHGWEVLSPCAFEAEWDGGSGVEAVKVRPVEGTAPAQAPVSLFGSGVLTFHVEGLFRTPPGWDLWVGGSPNRLKDAIAPLTGVVETDWSPFTFTLNWRFTRPHRRVAFVVDEPVGFLFPVPRDALERFRPRFAPLEAAPDLGARFSAWSRSRDAFQARLVREPPKAPADAWQKHYFRGADADGRVLASGHRTKLRLRGFDADAGAVLEGVAAEDCEAAPTPESAPAEAAVVLRRRERLMEATERQRAAAPACAAITRRSGLSRDEFAERYYAPARPVILAGEMAGWRALDLWTPDYLAGRIGRRVVAALQARSTPAAAQASGVLAGPLEVLAKDIDVLDVCLGPRRAQPDGALTLQAGGGLLPLHSRTENLLLAQVTGRSRLRLLPASEAGRLYERADGSSAVADIDDPAFDATRYPLLEGAHCYEVALAPGEALFLPLGWWRQVRSLEISVALEFTGFAWPNDPAAE